MGLMARPDSRLQANSLFDSRPRSGSLKTLYRFIAVVFSLSR